MVSSPAATAAHCAGPRWQRRRGCSCFDEPLSAPDALERCACRQEIRALQQKLGVTTIMVTHDQEEALSVADRIVVMNHGVIEQIGDAISVYREPATPFVADFGQRTYYCPGASRAGNSRGTVQVAHFR